MAQAMGRSAPHPAQAPLGAKEITTDEKHRPKSEVRSPESRIPPPNPEPRFEIPDLRSTKPESLTPKPESFPATVHEKIVANRRSAPGHAVLGAEDGMGEQVRIGV